MTTETAATWAEAVPGQDRPMTEDDLIALPDDAWRYELVQGRLLRMPPTGMEHDRVTSLLYVALYRFVNEGSLGRVTLPETGFTISRPGEADTVLAPDTAFIAAGRLPRTGPHGAEGYAHLAPDLVVEVASPSQHRPELAAKMRVWITAGVRLGWVVWPRRRQVDLWRHGRLEPEATLGVADRLEGLDVLPGFSFAVRQLFE